MTVPTSSPTHDRLQRFGVAPTAAQAVHLRDMEAVAAWSGISPART